MEWYLELDCKAAGMDQRCEHDRIMFIEDESCHEISDQDDRYPPQHPHVILTPETLALHYLRNGAPKEVRMFINGQWEGWRGDGNWNDFITERLRRAEENG